MDKDQLRESMKAAMDGVTCPDTESLLLYRENRESARAREIAQHVEGCARCQALLSDIADFFEPPRPGETATPDTGAEWLRLRDHLPVPRRRWSALPAIAASLLAAASLGTTAMLWNQRLQLDERLAKLEQDNAALRVAISKPPVPMLNVFVRDLMPLGTTARNGATDSIQSLRADLGGTLILNGIPAAVASRLEVVATDGRLIWKGGPLDRTQVGAHVLLLPPGFALPGRYRIQVYAEREGSPITTYQFELR